MHILLLLLNKYSSIDSSSKTNDLGKFKRVLLYLSIILFNFIAKYNIILLGIITLYSYLQDRDSLYYINFLSFTFLLYLLHITFNRKLNINIRIIFISVLIVGCIIFFNTFEIIFVLMMLYWIYVIIHIIKSYNFKPIKLTHNHIMLNFSLLPIYLFFLFAFRGSDFVRGILGNIREIFGLIILFLFFISILVLIVLYIFIINKSTLYQGDKKAVRYILLFFLNIFVFPFFRNRYIKNKHTDNLDNGDSKDTTKNEYIIDI